MQFESPVLYCLTYLHLRFLFLIQATFTSEVSVWTFVTKDIALFEQTTLSFSRMGFCMPYCLHLPWIDSFHYASQTAPEAWAFIGQNLVKGDNPEESTETFIFHYSVISRPCRLSKMLLSPWHFMLSYPCLVTKVPTAILSTASALFVC